MTGRTKASTSVPPLRRDSVAPWRDPAPVALGTTDAEWRITSLSAGIFDIIGKPPDELVGSLLLDQVHPDDWARVPRRVDRALSFGPGKQARVLDRHGLWVDVRLLAAPLPGDDPAGAVFAVVGLHGRPPAVSADRLADLERRLWAIAAEVQGAGLLDTVAAGPSPTEFPQLAQLSTRQWEILNHLLRGERVATIAAGLYISPSTVRSHLAAIFDRFGVHSQEALIQVLLQPHRATRP